MSLEKVNKTIFSTALFLVMISCNNSEQQGTAEGSDSIPGVVVPPAHDTQSVITTPPVNDSNSIMPDSAGTSR